MRADAIDPQPARPTPSRAPAEQPPAVTPRRTAADALRDVIAVLARWRATAHGVEPEFWRRLGQEIAGGRQWLDRAVVLGYAAATGLVVVGFTLLAEVASHGFEQLRSSGAWAPWLMRAWTPALTIALLW